jgi:anaerobic selenocysteine-containing dehydrogenase
MPKKITRRDFLKAGAIGAASTVVLAGCQKTRRWVVLEPFVKPPEEQLAGVATWYASTCRQCPAGCGIIVRIMNGRALKLEGNPQHPLNQGKLCARGQAGLQVLYNPDRINGALLQKQRGTRQYASISWNEAINRLAVALEGAGGQTAVWLGSTTSGHLYDLFSRYSAAVGAPGPLVWDAYTALNGYAALVNNSQTLFGQAGLPYYDVGNADVILSFNSNILGAELSQVRYGIEFGKFRSRSLGGRGYLVQIEPRMSMAGVKADDWVAINPGTEGLAAAAITRIIADQNLGLADRISRAQAIAPQVDVNAAAAATGISASDLARLAGVFARATHPVALPGTSLNGQNDGGAALSAVQALNIIAGGNAVNLTAAAPVPNLAKPQPVVYPDALALIEDMRAGKVKTLLVYGANPAYDLPAQAGFVEAVKNVQSVVSFAPLIDETAVWADLVLPDRTYLEGWGYEVVSPDFGMPAVSGQQPVVTPVFDTRATGDVLLEAAKAIPAAAKALTWPDEVAFIQEMVTKLPPGAAGGSGSAVLWARFQQYGGWWPAAPPAVSELKSAVSTPLAAPQPAFQAASSQYPYALHIYVNDLLSDGRGASQRWLQGSPDPMTTLSWQTWLEINPGTAAKIGLKDGDLVRVTSPYAEVQALVYTYPAIGPDVIAMPTGQGHTDLGRLARDRGSNPVLLAGSQVDKTGSNLVWSGVRVKLTPTGQRVDLATFEYKPGVEQGFPNETLPGL